MKVDIYDILTWVFFLLAVILFFWYIFGNSPTIEWTLLILIIGLLFKIQGSVNSNKVEITYLKRGFNALAKDFKEHITHK